MCLGKKLGEVEAAREKEKREMEGVERELVEVKRLHADQCDMVSQSFANKHTVSIPTTYLIIIPNKRKGNNQSRFNKTA